MAFSDARNERDRAETGRNSSNHGGGNARAAEARNREAMARGLGFGGNRLAGNATVADHMIATGRISAPSIGPGGVARGNYNTQDEAYNDYAKAVGDYATRGTLGRVADRLLGGWYDENEPMSTNPRSFAGGDFHSSSNPGSIAGGIGGMFAGPLGILAGPLAGAAYNASGLPHAWHGGYDQPIGNAPSAGPAAPSTGNVSTAAGGATPSGAAQGYQGGGMGGPWDRGAQLFGMPPKPQSAFPQSTQRSAAPTIPGIPNRRPNNPYGLLAWQR